MGATYVNATIRNPADPGRAWEGRFLVDAGAFDCLAPRDALEGIGLTPRGEREYVLADGSAVGLEFAIAEVELMGEPTGAAIIFGDADAQPLLGATALESTGFEVDPRDETLKKLPAILLKSSRGLDAERSALKPAPSKTHAGAL